ncbi:MAG: TlpA disulfide reductase family protein [Alistipes sp.]|nr:TlpA disulfide reductase family protein [Alistipes sp.]
MKRFSLLGVMSLLLLLSACHSTSEPAKWEAQRTVITGRILHPELHPNQNRVQVQFNPLLKQNGQNMLTLQADSVTGVFRLETELAYPQEIFLNYRTGYHLFVTPGDSLYVELNAEIWDAESRRDTLSTPAIQFSGNPEAAKLNASMYGLQKFFRPLVDKYQDQQSLQNAIMNSQSDAFEVYIVEREKEYRAYWKKYRSQPEYDPSLKPWIEDMLRYDAYFGRVLYMNTYFYLQQEHGDKMEIPDLPEEFSHFLKKYDPNDNQRLTYSHALFLDEYYQYLMNTVNRQMEQDTTITSNDQAFDYLTRYMQTQTKGFTREFMQCKFYMEMILNAPAEAVEKHLGNLTLQNAYFQQKIQHTNAQMEALRTATPPEGIEFIVPDTSVTPDLFERLVAPYAGKVVYVDFWAPWCAPCMEEMPASVTLQQRYKNQEVVFLFLCGDATETAWRSTVLTQNITGIHLKPSDAQMEAIYNRFKIEGIPHYLILDRTGKVVVEDAPRPSEPDAVASQLRKLL